MADAPRIDVPQLSIADLHKYIPRSHRSEIPSTPKSLPPECETGDILPEQYADYMLLLVAAYCRAMKDGLELYRPLPAAALFHGSMAPRRLLTGSNQSGKTLTAMAEFARIIRGRDPYKKLPDRNLNTMSVGLDQKYLGQVLWKKLWFPGAFEIVPDEIDGFWRAVRPDPNDPLHLDPIDLARKHLWQPAPSLVPPDEIKHVSWANAGEAVPSVMTMHNGTESLFCTSDGNVRQGVQMHFINFSEEIAATKWLDDAFPRLVKYNGLFLWDCTPENSTQQLFELHRRVLAGDPYISEHKLLIDDNPFFTDESKKILYTDLAAQGAETLAVKYYGEYAIAGRAAYPMYDLNRHGCDPHPIPHDWMVVAAIDPGSRAQCAVLGAVPPDGSRLEVYATIIVKNQDAAAFARELKKYVGWRTLEAYVIDRKGSEPRAPGRPNTTADHYDQAFKEAGIRPSRLSNGFVYGSDDCEARELSVKAMLINDTLKIHRSPINGQLDHQMKNRFYDKNNRGRRESRTEHEGPDCLEYLVAFFDGGLYYVAPPAMQEPNTAHDRRVVEEIERRKSGKPRNRITGFAGGVYQLHGART